MGQHKVIAAVLLASLGAGAWAAGEADARFADVPQFAALKQKVYRSVGAQGYVVRTDSLGRVASTSDARDFDFRSVSYDPKAKVAKVALVNRRFTIVILQDWRYGARGWEYNQPTLK
jgi:hypothetical protein